MPARRPTREPRPSKGRGNGRRRRVATKPQADADEFGSLAGREINHVRDLIERAENALESLPQLEQQVIRLRFGIDGVETHSPAQVAKRLRVSAAILERIELRAIRKLRDCQ